MFMDSPGWLEYRSFAFLLAASIYSFLLQYGFIAHSLTTLYIYIYNQPHNSQLLKNTDLFCGVWSCPIQFFKEVFFQCAFQTLLSLPFLRKKFFVESPLQWNFFLLQLLASVTCWLMQTNWNGFIMSFMLLLCLKICRRQYSTAVGVST